MVVLEKTIKHLKSHGVNVLLLQIPNTIKKELSHFGIDNIVDRNKVFENVEDTADYLESNRPVA